MKNLFLTTALVLPLAMGPAFAQQPVAPLPDATQDGSAVTDPAADATTGADAAPDAVDAPDATVDDSAVTDPATDAVEAPADIAEPTAVDEAAIVEEEVVVTDPDKIVQQQAANELRLDWINGAGVTSPDGEPIGSVSDLILDRDTGQMVAAVIGVGGFLGIGEKKIAVPWDRLTIDYDANQITSDLSRAEADAAPEYAFRERETLPPPVDAAPADTAVPPGVPPVAPPAATE